MAANTQKQKILILGGGFGGIKAALELADDPAFKVTLLSDQTNFRYYPTLYSAAVGGSSFASSIPLSEIFEGKKIDIVQARAKYVDRAAKVVSDTKGHKYPYDILIVALGVVTNYFGIKGLKEYSFGVKTLEEAQELRDHLHQQLLDYKKPDINYIVIGGGPTGVELSGALPSYISRIMQQHGLPERKVRVELVEAAPRLLPRLPRGYSRAVQKQLRKLGVKLTLGQAVQAETADALVVDGRPIKSRTVVWTAGVTNHPFLKDNKFNITDHGKAVVDRYLQAEPGIFIVGDNADTKYSGMAQTALYDGLFVAENLKRLANGKKAKKYKANKPIYITPAGPRWAAVLWGRFHVYGWLGYILRRAGDLRGYRDYQPWWQASKHWLAEGDTQETCSVCIQAQ